MTRAFKQGFMDMMQKIATSPAFWMNTSGKWDLPSENTYFGQLARNTANPQDFVGQQAWDSKNKVTGTLFGAGRRMPAGTTAEGVQITPTSDIPEDVRTWQAGSNARDIFAVNSPEWTALQNNLINAGKNNAESFKATGSVNKRTEPDMTGLEGINITPDQKSKILQMQNTMANNGGQQFGAMA
jgi:hypothetical protein